MAVITATDLNAHLDELCRMYLRALGTEASGYGMGVKGGSWGAAGVVASLKAALLAIPDTNPTRALVGPVEDIEPGCNAAAVMGGLASPIVSALNQHIGRFQVGGASPVRTIDDYLLYLNIDTGGTWAALQHPSWRDLYTAIQGAAPAIANLYFEVLQGAVYADALGKFIASGAGTGAFTDGFAVDSTKYAGGFPQVRTSGLGGTGVITVTGDFYDRATKAVQTAKTATATISANGVASLAPGGADPCAASPLILNVTNITIAAGITAGTFYVEGARPSGRPLLP